MGTFALSFPSHPIQAWLSVWRDTCEDNRRWQRGLCASNTGVILLRNGPSKRVWVHVPLGAFIPTFLNLGKAQFPFLSGFTQKRKITITFFSSRSSHFSFITFIVSLSRNNIIYSTIILYYIIIIIIITHSIII